ncbi:MAG: hypothetical protein JWM74_2583, partial [Myxococcaceae bacterium]|nr:hypothetical protein [Myxococcaceae bacterium]
DGAALDATGGIDVDGAHYDSCLRFCEHVNPDRGPVVSCSFEDRPEGESSAGDYTGRIACVHDGVTCERSTIVEGPGWNL